MIILDKIEPNKRTMKKKLLFLLLIGTLISCSSEDDAPEKNQTNEILMLKVDYTTNDFEGGTTFHFSQPAAGFTITNEYVPPGDFGSVKLIYEEINEILFFGSIVWMGLGKMEFPENLQPADPFEVVLTEDYVFPENGLENVFDPTDQFEENFDYEEIWSSVQSLVKVREYLSSNPNQSVKLFLYTPSVGVGDPSDWNWIIYMKK